jgi:pimeloyl-ACP methyl ester carboxylesterase
MPSYNAIHIDDSRWVQHNTWLNVADPEIRIHWIECKPASGDVKGTILLIHGFPQTSYQFRHVITPLADAGYHVIAPDYRGAGESSHPKEGYTKVVMAGDLHELITKHIGIKGKVHVVGHDIGGIIAHAFVAQFPESVASVVWGECPLPGTSVYEKHKHTDFLYHFTFQNVPDLPEALVTGRERIYLKHFYDR